jgi:hypothetical protein
MKLTRQAKKKKKRDEINTTTICVNKSEQDGGENQFFIPRISY